MEPMQATSSTLDRYERETRERTFQEAHAEEFERAAHLWLVVPWMTPKGKVVCVAFLKGKCYDIANPNWRAFRNLYAYAGVELEDGRVALAAGNGIRIPYERVEEWLGPSGLEHYVKTTEAWARARVHDGRDHGGVWRVLRAVERITGIDLKERVGATAC